MARHAEPPPVSVFDGVASTTLGDVLLSLWRTPAELARIEHVMAVTEELLGRTPGSIVACQFLLATASPPGRAERSAVRAGLRIVLPRARRLITVPLGDATWHAVVRTLIRAALVLTRQAKIIKVAAGAPEAFDLVAEVATPRSPGRDALEATFAALHAALDLPSPRRGGRAR
ncbi:MAG: hypothetical protein HY908_08260 [Myxococcales bacterium]|nr:hypothetical protein [Myxococcales bacterium]